MVEIDLSFSFPGSSRQTSTLVSFSLVFLFFSDMIQDQLFALRQTSPFVSWYITIDLLSCFSAHTDRTLLFFPWPIPTALPTFSPWHIHTSTLVSLALLDRTYHFFRWHILTDLNSCFPGTFRQTSSLVSQHILIDLPYSFPGISQQTSPLLSTAHLDRPLLLFPQHIPTDLYSCFPSTSQQTSLLLSPSPSQQTSPFPSTS
ncbi:unnamed protein product [Acanthosepion pharaonis]|uniref:Uncharacterized protein n=1 Tax=Acanthosepion pharaonis TaxID=158019 RepID=A0A812DFS4_ACAPH|nr:unnamed protein product [Sepia pharaonis]